MANKRFRIEIRLAGEEQPDRRVTFRIDLQLADCLRARRLLGNLIAGMSKMPDGE